MKYGIKTTIATSAFLLCALTEAAEAYSCKGEAGTASVTTRRGEISLILKNHSGNTIHKSTNVRMDIEYEHIAKDFCERAMEPSITEESMSRDGTYTCTGSMGGSSTLKKENGVYELSMRDTYKTLVTSDGPRAMLIAQLHCNSSVPGIVLIRDYGDKSGALSHNLN